MATTLLVHEQAQEKIKTTGVKNLTDVELVATLLGNANTVEGLNFSRNLLSHFNESIGLLLCATSAQLIECGCTMNQSCRLIATFEVARRAMDSRVFNTKVSSSADIFSYMRPKMVDLIHEEFHVICLSRANRIINTYQLSIGGGTGTAVDIAKALRHCISTPRCSAIVLCHNHPSGNLRPSEADVRITRQFKEAAKLVEFTILDHVIIGGASYDKYLSFADEGLI